MVRVCESQCMAFIGTPGNPKCQLLDVASKLPGMLKQAPPPPVKPPPLIR